MQVTLINSMGTDQTVVDAARVSFAKKAETEKVAQDISREMKHLFPLSWAALEQNNG